MNIFFHSAVLQVARLVIGLIAVFVIDLLAVRTWPDKRSRNQRVHFQRFHTLPVAQVDKNVAVPICEASQNFARVRARTIPVASYSTVVGNGIQVFIMRDWPPLLTLKWLICNIKPIKAQRDQAGDGKETALAIPTESYGWFAFMWAYSEQFCALRPAVASGPGFATHSPQIRHAIKSFITWDRFPLFVDDVIFSISHDVFAPFSECVLVRLVRLLQQARGPFCILAQG